jgi:carbonic anhydrase
MYRHSESLATPPCIEGVIFNIFSKPIDMGAKQIEAFVNAHDGNNRPAQPVNVRVVSRAYANNSKSGRRRFEPDPSHHVS